MTEVKVHAIRDNSFKVPEEGYDPQSITNGSISIDNATGLKITITKEEGEDTEYYYIGQEITREQYLDMRKGQENTDDYLDKELYAQEYDITRYGIIWDGNYIKEVKPINKDEHMVNSQEELFKHFNKAETLSHQKVLTLIPKRKKPNTVAA